MTNGIITLALFIASVSNGQNLVRGVYAPGIFAFSVIHCNRVCVPDRDNTFSQYNRAQGVALLAHDYLGGSHLEDLKRGQEIILVYGNGRTVSYTVTWFEQWKANDPYGSPGPFVNYITGERVSEDELFNRIYGVKNRVVFQTCFDNDYGRLFVIALPKELDNSHDKR